MKARFKRSEIIPVYVLTAFVFILTSEYKDDNKGRTWATYKADEKSTGYSPFNQTITANVGQLKNVWTFSINDAPQGEQPAPNNANVSSYFLKVKQYIALTVNSTVAKPSGSIMTFASP